MYPDDGTQKVKTAERLEQLRRAGRLGGLMTQARRLKADKKHDASSTPSIDASSDAQAMLKPIREGTRNGSGSDLEFPEGGAGETNHVQFHGGRSLEALQDAYPQYRVTYGERTETAYIKQLNANQPASQAHATMMRNLELHKRSDEWKRKGMTPSLWKWLEDGLWKRELDEQPPPAERPVHRAVSRRGCGHEPPCLTHSDHVQRELAEARAADAVAK